MKNHLNEAGYDILRRLMIRMLGNAVRREEGDQAVAKSFDTIVATANDYVSRVRIALSVHGMQDEMAKELEKEEAAEAKSAKKASLRISRA